MSNASARPRQFRLRRADAVTRNLGWLAALGAVMLLVGCNPTDSREASADDVSAGAPASSAQVTGPEAFKLTVPQNDLDVVVDGFRIIPPMGMGSWAAFSPTGSGQEMVVMGDVVVQGSEVGPVQRVVVEQGLTVTGLHNHFARAEPPVLYMHVRGRGEASALRDGVEAVFGRVAELRGGDPGQASADQVDNTLDTTMIDETLGHSGSMSRGVYKVTIGRTDVALMADGVHVTTDMGFNTWAAWQGAPEHSAVSGDFAMLADEVEAVIEALVGHGIEVVALHNHMVHEEPRVFFLHYWGVGPALDLARGLRAALDRTGTPPAG